MSTGTLTSPVLTAVTNHYEIHGYGGSPLVQARLAAHGQFSHVTWEPGPPAWRLHYDSPLSLSEVEQRVQDLIRRYDLKFYAAR
jgi:hypothetical protein